VSDQQFALLMEAIGSFQVYAERSTKALERIAVSLEEGVAVDVVDIQQPAINSIAAAVE